MEWSGWIAIVVALLGIAGGIWTQIIQFKKDARQIDNLKSDVGNVKVDTGTMLPTLQYTDENVKKIRDHVVEKIYPAVSAVQNSSEKSSAQLQRLIDELNYQERCRENASNAVENRDYFIAGIDNLYAENMALNQQVKELMHERSMDRQELHKLQIENTKLRDEKLQLEKKIEFLRSYSNQYSNEQSRGHSHGRSDDFNYRGPTL